MKSLQTLCFNKIIQQCNNPNDLYKELPECLVNEIIILRQPMVNAKRVKMFFKRLYPSSPINAYLTVDCTKSEDQIRKEIHDIIDILDDEYRRCIKWDNLKKYWDRRKDIDDIIDTLKDVYGKDINFDDFREYWNRLEKEVV